MATHPGGATAYQDRPGPGLSPQWFTHFAFFTQNQKNQDALTPGVLVLANSGGIPRTPPRDRGIPVTRAAAVGPNPLRRSIRSLRLRLDRIPIRSRPSDPDPTAEIQRQRFGLALFLKRPPTLPKSTCGPALVKSIYGLVLFLAHNPLSFFKIGPAVQVCSFCGLDPEALVYLRFSPWFLQKTPLNPVFLTNKPLELVFSLEYAF